MNTLHAKRIAAVKQNLTAMKLSQTLICDPLSIWYLTGYYTEPFERFLALYLGTGEQNQRPDTLFCNVLFPDASSYFDHVVTFSDTDNPIPLLADTCDSTQTLGIDKMLTARWLLPLIDTQAAAGFCLASEAIDAARSLKDAFEQDLMREASRVNDEAMSWLAAQVRPGVTERQIADGLLKEYRRLGAEDHSFTPIVSFGANAADPHHEPDDTLFQTGDMVLFDVGCKRNWYCSDMTRVFFTATPSERQLLIYNTVRRANEAAAAIVKPGVTFAEIDLTARKVIEDAGFGPYFTHRLGHQIGLQDHEPGDVSASHHEPVQVGQCFSIEPGIYIPGEIGVRIEDLVIVTEDGCEVINHYPHDVQVLAV